MSHNHHQPLNSRRPGSVEHVLDHGAAPHFMQNFGEGRLHASAFAGGQHDGNGCSHGEINETERSLKKGSSERVSRGRTTGERCLCRRRGQSPGTERTKAALAGTPAQEVPVGERPTAHFTPAKGHDWAAIPSLVSRVTLGQTTRAIPHGGGLSNRLRKSPLP